MIIETAQQYALSVVLLLLLNLNTILAGSLFCANKYTHWFASIFVCLILTIFFLVKMSHTNVISWLKCYFLALFAPVASCLRHHCLLSLICSDKLPLYCINCPRKWSIKQALSCDEVMFKSASNHLIIRGYLVSHEIKLPSINSDVGVSLKTQGSMWTPVSDRVEKVSPLISLFCFLSHKLDSLLISLSSNQ